MDRIVRSWWKRSEQTFKRFFDDIRVHRQTFYYRNFFVLQRNTISNPDIKHLIHKFDNIFLDWLYYEVPYLISILNQYRCKNQTIIILESHKDLLTCIMFNLNVQFFNNNQHPLIPRTHKVNRRSSRTTMWIWMTIKFDPKSSPNV